MGQSVLNTNIKKAAIPFQTADDLSTMIDSIKDKKIVMLGESTHGTHEFYELRSKISRELIEKHGFKFIAVEGDWPACHQVNLSIQNSVNVDPLETLSNFSRWPTWMWANVEMIDLMKWMSEWNEGLEHKKDHIGFHGLDVYSLYDSIERIKTIAFEKDPRLLENLQEFYSCFDPYFHDEKAYVKSLFNYPEGCEGEVADALQKILASNLARDNTFFDVVQNARIIRNAEKYYRAMMTGENSWNIRDFHMMETLERLIDFYGDDTKGIVWAHNTHIGDYRATDMLLNDQINIGGLARKRYGEKNVALIGLTTYSGTVIASSAWDGKIEVMKVPEAMTDSFENILHEAIPFVGSKQFYLPFDSILKEEKKFQDYIGHRAIGVVYHPHYEAKGNYIPSVVNRRYDGVIFIDHTSALTPLRVAVDKEKIPETYPFGAHI